MTEIVMIHDLVNPKTGKTYREENLEKRHAIPVGTLVELEWNAWHGKGACWNMRARLWVVMHGRDCDGTPLYTVSDFQTAGLRDFPNFREESLTPVEVTPALRDGHEIPYWYDCDGG